MKRRLSTSTRITLTNAAVLVLCFAVLLYALMRLTSYFMLAHIEESMRSELTLLESDFAHDGDFGLRSLVQARIDRYSPGHERYYWYESPELNIRVTNMATWPHEVIDEQTYYLDSPKHGSDSRVVGAAINMSGGRRLFVGYDEWEMHALQDRLERAAWMALLVIFVVAYGASRLMTKNLFRPVAMIRESAFRIMHGDIQHRIPVIDNGDELDELAKTLNNMLNRIEQLIISIQGATDNIAHDLRSPLTRLRAHLETVREQPAENYEAWVDEQLAELDRVLGIFNVLLRISRMDKGLLRQDFKSVNIAALLQDAVEYVEPLAEAKDMQLRTQIVDAPQVICHKDLMFQVIINLLDNAIKYAPTKACIRLACQREGQQLKLVVEDNGAGIPAADRERVLERFYRGDASRSTEGAGLGLSLVKEVVLLHGGTLTLSDANPGLRVEIVIQLASV